MIKPSFLEPGDAPVVMTTVFGAPLVVEGHTGLPLIELVASAVLACVARHLRPDWSLPRQIVAGMLAATAMLGSEWCHNLAHAAVAWRIGKPVNAIRNFWGTPLLIYYDINDQAVTPRQHLLRASGGPIFNTLMVPFTWFIKQLTPHGSLSRYIADFTLAINSSISILSLLPIPGLDGGAILKWALVEKGRTIPEADQSVKAVNRFMGFSLAGISAVAIKKRRPWHGAGIALLAILSLAVGYGLLKEQKEK